TQPAEWARHAACWLAWPSHEDLWLANLPAAREAFVALAEAIGKGERLDVLVPDSEQEALASRALARVSPRFHRVPFGGIWLRDPNRNPGMGEADIAAGVRAMLGIRKLVWLGDGLLNDHTDGHVDNVARFVAPGVAVCMEARSDDDPNRDALEAIARDLAAST